MVASSLNKSPSGKAGEVHNVDVKVADRVAFELLLGRQIAVYIEEPTDPMPLLASVQRRPRQMRVRRPKRIEAVGERQQCVPAKSDDDRLIIEGERCRFLAPSGRSAGQSRLPSGVTWQPSSR